MGGTTKTLKRRPTREEHQYHFIGSETETALAVFQILNGVTMVYIPVKIPHLCFSTSLVTNALKS